VTVVGGLSFAVFAASLVVLSWRRTEDAVPATSTSTRTTQEESA
jgi:hypothetical protein